MKEKSNKEATDNNLFENLWFKLFPYWPLFAILSVLFLVVAFVFSQRDKPTYTVAASIAINDEAAALASNQPIRALNAFSVRQTVDNEVLVLKSRSLMKSVVSNLHLYAPVVQQMRFTETPVYVSSPVIVEAQRPDSTKRVERVYFSFHKENNTVEIKGKRYPLNQWINFPFATIRFVRNPRNEVPQESSYYFSLLDPSAVAGGLLSGLTVTAVSKLSTVINLSLQAESAQKAADVLNELLREYMRRTVESENQLAASTLMFVEQRLQDVENDLDSIERRIQQFRTAKGVIDLSQQGRIYLESVAENDRAITTINTQLAVLDQVDRFLNAQGQQTGIIPTTLGINDPVLAQLLQRLNDLELQRANLRTTAGEENPLVTSIESEIQKIRPNIRGIVSNQRSRLVASRNNLASSSNRFGSNIQNIPAQERELLEISRQQEVKRDLYSFLLQRREEAALSNSSNIANSQVIDWADPNAAAANSKKMLFLLGGLIAAIAAAIAYIIFREALGNKMLFRSTIESLTAVPVMGEILYRKKGSPLSLLNVDQKPALAQFRQLQAALGFFENGTAPKKILVTSSVFNEGKTFVSSHLAAALALSGKKVVLLDGNLYKPEASGIFSLQQAPGFKDFLENRFPLPDLVKPTGIQGLYMIPAGSPSDNPLSLLGKEKLAELVGYLEQQFDHIIFDSPPVELATDAYILSGVCDLTLFVIRHGVTPKTLIRKLDDNPRIAQIANMKIVFNGIKGRGLVQKFYGFGFGYGREKVFSKKAYLKAG